MAMYFLHIPIFPYAHMAKYGHMGISGIKPCCPGFVHVVGACVVGDFVPGAWEGEAWEHCEAAGNRGGAGGSRKGRILKSEKYGEWWCNGLYARATVEKTKSKEAEQGSAMARNSLGAQLTLQPHLIKHTHRCIHTWPVYKRLILEFCSYLSGSVGQIKQLLLVQ